MSRRALRCYELDKDNPLVAESDINALLVLLEIIFSDKPDESEDPAYFACVTPKKIADMYFGYTGDYCETETGEREAADQMLKMCEEFEDEYLQDGKTLQALLIGTEQQPIRAVFDDGDNIIVPYSLIAIMLGVRNGCEILITEQGAREAERVSPAGISQLDKDDEERIVEEFVADLKQATADDFKI